MELQDWMGKNLLRNVTKWNETMSTTCANSWHGSYYFMLFCHPYPKPLNPYATSVY